MEIMVIRVILHLMEGNESPTELGVFAINQR
jgi:hypothetical protein